MMNTSALESFIKDPTNDPDIRLKIYNHWGSFMRAYVSMFEITLANWGPNCWLLMNEVHECWGFFFIFWRCCFGFAVIQVITSVFIQHTFKVASRDEDVMIQEKQKASEAYLKHLDKLFTSLDESCDGLISREEFDAALKQPRVKYWFGALGVDVSDVPKLFLMLDNGRGQISKQEFIDGLKRAGGAVQHMDIVAIKHDLKQLKSVFCPDKELLIVSMVRSESEES